MEIKTEIRQFLDEFPFPVSNFEVIPLYSGHINQTFKVISDSGNFLVQKLNDSIFTNLEVINTNVNLVANHLKEQNYSAETLRLVELKDGTSLYKGQWRAFYFIENSVDFLKVQSREQSYEAAKLLGEFHRCLLGIDIQKLKSPIPDFLNFNKRLEQFKISIKTGNNGRINKVKSEVDFLLNHVYILEDWEKISSDFPLRLIHADPKISNFLFQKENPEKCLALVDWDTLMLGPLLYDFGDMIRSFANKKEEDDAEKGEVFCSVNYQAIKEGFLFNLHDVLTDKELAGFESSAKVVVYIQALRFLTDYLNNDQHYQISYPSQNLNRAKNQINMLKEMIVFFD